MYRIIGYNEPTDTAGFVILDQRVGRTVIEGKLTLKESDIDDLTLVVAKNNPLFDNVKTFHTHVEVYDDKELIFRGRAIKPKKSMESSGEFRREYIFEDIEAYLLDSVQRFYEGVGEKPVDFLKHLIEVHNSQVDKFQQFEVRNVTVTDGKDDAYRQIDYPKTRDAIKDKLLQSLGGYVVTTYKPGGPNYLDYLKDIGQDHKNDTPIQLSRNMKSASVQIDPTKVITRLVPLGKTLEPETVTVAGGTIEGGGATEPVNGDWTPVIKYAGQLSGEHLSDDDIANIKRRIQIETGNGDESIVNTWDSNAAAGHPSAGLLQFVETTFDKYKREPFTTWKGKGGGISQLIAMMNIPNWREQISPSGGWSPHGEPITKEPIKVTAVSSSWAWPFPNVGEGSFMQAQRFGNDGGYRTNSFHDGLDFGSVDHPGSEVHAIHGGTVTFKGYMGGLGNYVVTHSSDGFNIVYQEAFSSQSKIRVNVGDQIKTGDIIGWRDLDHLHVGVTKTDFYKAVQKSFVNDGTWLDPQQLIKNGGDGSQASDKSQEVSNKDSARPKLTIADVNGGKDYLDIPDLQKEFGIIEGTVEFDNVNDPNVLLQQAKAWIQAQRIPESWSLTAIEVGLPNFNHFKVGDRYMFINPYVAKDQLLRVVQKEIDLLKPHASTLTIGDKQIGLTDYQLEVNRNQQAFERVRVLVNQMAAVQANTAVNQNPVVVDAGTGEDVSQLKFDMTQLQKVIKDQIPTGYVSVDEFNKLKAQVDALKGGS